MTGDREQEETKQDVVRERREINIMARYSDSATKVAREREREDTRSRAERERYHEREGTDIQKLICDALWLPEAQPKSAQT